MQVRDLRAALIQGQLEKETVLFTCGSFHIQDCSITRKRKSTPSAEALSEELKTVVQKELILNTAKAGVWRGVKGSR